MRNAAPFEIQATPFAVLALAGAFGAVVLACSGAGTSDAASSGEDLTNHHQPVDCDGDYDDDRNCDPCAAAADGTACGTGRVCAKHVCTACVSGASCAPSNPCRAAAISCAKGPVCVDGPPLADGTACGTGRVCTAGTCGAVVTDPAGSLIGRDLVIKGRCFTPSDFCATYRGANTNTEFDTSGASLHVHFEANASGGVDAVLTGVDVPFPAPWFHAPAMRATMGKPVVSGGMTDERGQGNVPQTHPYGEWESLVVDVETNPFPNPQGPWAITVYFDAHMVAIPSAPSCPIDNDGDATDVSCSATFK